MRILAAIAALALAAWSVSEALGAGSVAISALRLFLSIMAAGAAGALSVVALPRWLPERTALLRGLDLLRGYDGAVLLLADGQGRILHVNDAAKEVYGRRREELLGVRLADLRHPTAPPWPDGLPPMPAPGARTSVESVHQRFDGSPFPAVESARTLLLDGAPHLFVVVEDASERVIAQAAIAEGMAQHRYLLANLPMFQFTLEPDGRIAALVGKGLEPLRIAPGKLVGRSVFEAARDLPGLLADFLRALRGDAFSSTTRIGERTFEIHWAPLARDDGTIRGVSGVGLDATERVAAERARQETEARLVAAERLASMGRLAAGVAHEINNPLSWVSSNLESAMARAREAGGDPAIVEMLGEAKVGADRVRDIVRDLRVFGRAEGERGGGCDAGAVIRASLSMTRNELRHRARVETSIEPVPPVAIPERQLGQVLVNLLVNAAQAIREGSAEENRVRVALRADGDQVVLEVADTGCGMASEVRGRIFEPFFTTKTGEGMGLGLALCETMVREAGGRIDVESAPGRGSTFRVLLPRAAEPTPVPRPADEVARGAATGVGRRRLLVVDDEPLVGRTVARALQEHEIECVTDAREALARVESGAAYDALICDLMMPEMSGMDLAARLAERSHPLAGRMLFLTGGAFTDRARAFLALTRAPVVEKPFEQAELRSSVARLLAYGAGGGASPNT